MFVQILMLLLFLPFHSIPRCLQRLDVNIKFELPSLKSGADPEGDNNVQSPKQDLKRRKHAAGGLANIIVVLAVIIISALSFAVLNQQPGSVTTKSSKLSNINNTFRTEVDEPSAIGFEISHTVAANGPSFDWNMTLFYSLSGKPSDAAPTFCRLSPFSEQRSEAKYSLDIFELMVPFKSNHVRVLSPIIGTVCGSETEFSRVAVHPSTPVIPALSKFPPSDVFTDKKNSQNVFVSLAENQTYVFTYKWNWVEMISTPTLDILSPVLATLRYQAPVTSLGWSLRDWNSSTDPNLGFEPVKFPECNASVGSASQSALFSFVLYSDGNSEDEASYVVQESSTFVWAITTIITLTSIYSLQPTIAGVLKKFANYWEMKMWLRWVLFTLYTVFVPLPFLYAVFKVVDGKNTVKYRDMEFIYNRYISDALLGCSIVLLIVWAITLARQIQVTLQDYRRRRMAADREQQVLLPEPNEGSL